MKAKELKEARLQLVTWVDSKDPRFIVSKEDGILTLSQLNYRKSYRQLDCIPVTKELLKQYNTQIMFDDGQTGYDVHTVDEFFEWATR